MNMFLIC